MVMEMGRKKQGSVRGGKREVRQEADSQEEKQSPGMWQKCVLSSSMCRPRLGPALHWSPREDLGSSWALSAAP